MCRRTILPLLFALTLAVAAACAPAGAPGQSDAPAPEPMGQAAAESPLLAAASASSAPESPLPAGDITSGESITAVQRLDWDADEDDCLIPGAVITGDSASLAPCEPVTEEPAGEAPTGDEPASDQEETEPVPTEPMPTEPAPEEPAQPQAEADEAARVAAMAVDDLAAQLGIPASEVEVREVRAVTWPDASMGCPEPDMMYAQMLQEGYLIRLSANGEIYHYHSGGGQAPFLCEDSLQVMPPSVRDALELVPPPDAEIDKTD